MYTENISSAIILLLLSFTVIRIMKFEVVNIDDDFDDVVGGKPHSHPVMG